MTVKIGTESDDIVFTNYSDAYAYDHPALRIFSKPSETIPILIHPEQQAMIGRQLATLDTDLAIDTMGMVALESRKNRDSWERQHLQNMGFHALVQYLQLAGDHTRIADLIEWFGALNPPDGHASREIVDASGALQRQSTIDDNKGRMIAIGTADQTGDWLKSEILDYAVELGLSELESSGKYFVRRFDGDNIRRHKIKILTEQGILDPSDKNRASRVGSRVIGLCVVREQALANVIPRYTRKQSRRIGATFKDSQHIIKRSETIVIPDAAMLRELIGSVAIHGNIFVASKGALEQETLRFVDRYEQLIHQDHTTLTTADDMDVSPVAMSIFVRNPAKNAI